MLAQKKHNQAKTPEGKPRQADAGTGDKHVPEQNPIWQSLAMQPASIQPELNVRQSPEQEGQPLDAEIRHPMERFFQQPLDRVRVFSGPDSRHAAESLGAFALTLGQNIHLGARGQALPGSQRKALLAHETVHTLQQGDIGRAPQLSSIQPDPEGSPHEREADGLSRAFMAHEAGYSAGLAIRDSIALRPFTSGNAQLSRVPTKYGEFEDYKFNDVKDLTGTKLGVQLYLKFHPYPIVDAKKIGMTQAAEGKVGGVQDTGEFRGRRQATTGAGTGYFIDMLEGVPSPMYRAEPTVTSGADATKIGSYAAPGIPPVTQAQLTNAGLNVTGIDYAGGSVYGYNYMDKGTVKGPVPAEMHDAPHIPGPTVNATEQIFETAALAFEGNMAGTYLGSVEWGWRRDAKGVFTPVPISIKSMGVPSVNFLTAATVWNPAREFFGLMANASPTNILKMNLTPDYTVLKGTPLQVTGVGTQGANTYYQVVVISATDRTPVLDASGNPKTGIVNRADTAEGDYGRETVDLPVPEIYTVSVASGTVLSGETLCSPSDPTLAQGTRVQLLGPFGTTVQGFVRVQVADGPLTGTRGVVARKDLTRETPGTH